MKKKFTLYILIPVLLILGVSLWGYVNYPRSVYYINSLIYTDLPVDSTDIPERNSQLLEYAHTNGPAIAPEYKDAVCTEYLVEVLGNFCPLDSQTEKKIQIITDQDLTYLLENDSAVTKGVYHALTSSGLGKPVDNIADAKAGDLVQFWNEDDGKPYGHCGILRAIDLKKGLISMYSSAKSTNGHDKQVYILPKYLYIVRLN